MSVSLCLIAFSSFVVAFSGALVPGPLLSMTIAEATRRGVVAGPLIIVGHGILELSLVILIIFGIAPFLTVPLAKTGICVIGGLVLIYLGCRMIRDARKALFSAADGKIQKGMHPVISGIIGSVSNPYWIMWWVTIGMGYLISSLKFGMLGVSIFFFGHISADLGWYSVVSFAVSRGRKVIGDSGYRLLLYSCGVFLIIFGIWFLKGI